MRLEVAARSNHAGRWRVLLILGRASNLPTVWSNCLAGWWLSGGGPLTRLLALCLGATFFYLGGMYLNDAMDASFDRQFRRERPIPAGLIDVATVGWLGAAWLALGILLLAGMGRTIGILAGWLLTAIVLYDLCHKVITFAPLLMAACRALLYLVAAAAGNEGVTGLSIWSGLALACYIVGLSYLARAESRPLPRAKVTGVGTPAPLAPEPGGAGPRSAGGPKDDLVHLLRVLRAGPSPEPLRWWSLVLLGAPIILALIANTGWYLLYALGLSVLLVLWVVHCLGFTLDVARPDIGRTVSGLLAGIVCVDALAVAGGSVEIASVFLALFFLARWSQRAVPAT